MRLVAFVLCVGCAGSAPAADAGRDTSCGIPPDDACCQLGATDCTSSADCASPSPYCVPFLAGTRCAADPSCGRM